MSVFTCLHFLGVCFPYNFVTHHHSTMHSTKGVAIISKVRGTECQALYLFFFLQLHTAFILNGNTLQ